MEHNKERPNWFARQIYSFSTPKTQRNIHGNTQTCAWQTAIYVVWSSLASCADLCRLPATIPNCQTSDTGHFSLTLSAQRFYHYSELKIAGWCVLTAVAGGVGAGGEGGAEGPRVGAWDAGVRAEAAAVRADAARLAAATGEALSHRATCTRGRERSTSAAE